MNAPTPPRDVPYLRQQRIDGQSRTCAAAALAMVYRAYGRPVDQATIWRSVASVDAGGRYRAPAARLACDALARGFPACAVQVDRDPWRALQLVVQEGQYAILNHRLSFGSATSHYSVLVACDAQRLVLHDPLYGPSRQWDTMRFASLWQRRSQEDEIAGMLLLVIGSPTHSHSLPIKAAARAGGAATCCWCGSVIPLWTGLPHRSARGDRCWSRVLCPYCDRTAIASGPDAERPAWRRTAPPRSGAQAL